MNICSNFASTQKETAGLLFTIDADGRFLMTDAMVDQLPFAGVSGNQLLRLHDLLGVESGDVLDALLAGLVQGVEEGLMRRVNVHDREGRPISLAIARLPGIAAGHFVCALDECRFQTSEAAEPVTQSLEQSGTVSRAEAVRLVGDLMVGDSIVGDPVKIILVGLNKPRNIEGPVAESIWSRLVKRAGRRLHALVGTRGLVAHYAEGVFAVVSAQQSGPLLPVMGTGSIVSSFDRPFEIDGLIFYVGVNLGVADLGAGPTDIGDSFRSAELALEEARRSGTPICECTAEMVKQAGEGFKFEQELREAFDYGGFKLALQPKYDVASGAVTGFEALIRWHHPERGVVQPHEFIPMAEKTGLIVPITDWVLHEVCRLLKEEQDAGRDPLPVSINIPPSQLMRREVKDFIKVINAYDVSASLIEFELTESISTGEISRGISMMSALRAAGVKISVEDFGVGSKSLSHLIKWPVSILKIDRDIVAALPEDREAGEVVAAITRIAQALNLSVVAEGVETERQKAFLADHGVEAIQGFLLSKPLAPEEAFRLAHNGAG